MSKLYISLSILFLLLVSCTTETSEYDSLEAPQVEFNLINEIRDSDDIMFGNIAAVEITKDHYVLAGDFSRNRLHIFDSNGTFIHSAINDGRGPGEIQRFFSFRVTEDNQVMIYDIPGQRFVFFDFTGTDLAFKYDMLIDSFPRYFHLSDQGEIIIYNTSSSASDEESLNHILKMDKDGTVIDESLLAFAPNEQITITTPEGRQIMSISSPHHSYYMMEYWGDRVFVANSTVTGFRVYDLNDGEKITKVNLERPDLPVTQEEKREFVDGLILATGMEDLSVSRYMAQIPDIKGKLSTIRYDPLGYVWLQIIEEEGYSWIVFSEDGELVGRVDEEYEGSIVNIRYGRIAMLSQDEFDVPMIQVYEYQVP